MPIYLDVPYEERSMARLLGARWDARIGSWYVPDGRDPAPFRRWIPPEPESIYLVFAEHACWRCGESTEVAGFGIPYAFYQDDRGETFREFETMGHHWVDTVDADRLSIKGELGCVPTEIRYYLWNRCGYKREAGGRYLTNTCTHCGTEQNYANLFDNVQSPFYVDSRRKLEALEFVRVEVEGVYGNGREGWHANDDAVYEYALRHHGDFPERLAEGIYL